jgi:hypothetical protein
MRLGRIALAGLALFLALLAPVGSARAWTEARIETAAAHVDVIGERALVSLELGVRVDGGWLTRLDLRGLEPALVLDPAKPAYVLTEDGRKLAPAVRTDGSGLVVLTFADPKRAPRRGRHLVGLVYEAPLATAGAAGSVPSTVWSLPAFLNDLREASIEVRAPRGSTLFARAVESPGATTLLQRGGHTTLALHAEHVPRGIALELAFVRPEAALGVQQAASAEASAVVPRQQLAAVALVVWLLGALKRRAARRLAREHGAQPVALLKLPHVASTLLGAALCAAFVAGYARAPGSALLALVLAVALALDRRFQRSPRSAPAPWPRGAARLVALGRARRARASRLFGGPAWLDATTPTGAVLLVSAYGLAVARVVLAGTPDVWLEALLVVTPLLVTATRLQLPASRHDALLAHLGAARALRRRRQSRSGVPKSPPASPPASQPLTSADADRRAPDRAA